MLLCAAKLLLSVREAFSTVCDPLIVDGLVCWYSTNSSIPNAPARAILNLLVGMASGFGARVNRRNSFVVPLKHVLLTTKAINNTETNSSLVLCPDLTLWQGKPGWLTVSNLLG